MCLCLHKTDVLSYYAGIDVSHAGFVVIQYTPDLSEWLLQDSCVRSKPQIHIDSV